MGVELQGRDFGGPDGAAPLVLLHGLLGSSRNWQGAAKRLAATFRVWAVDLRNHGDSPHADAMDYPLMADDVASWLDRQGLSRVHLLGHSMGGKAAMQLAVSQPRRIARLVVVDIAPRAYPPRWEREFAVMRRMPVERMQSRAEAEEWLAEDIHDWAFRKFLVTNLERCEAGGFRWLVNLAILEAALPNLFRQVPRSDASFAGPTLFLRGARSRFVNPATDAELMHRCFPHARMETIEDAGHNVHFDQPVAFVAAVTAFLQGTAE